MNTSTVGTVRTLAGIAILLLNIIPAIAQTAKLEPPKALGVLELAHELRGKEALQAIDRLHGKGVSAADAYVAHYEKDGQVAMLYVSRPARSSMTGAQIDRMVAGIRTGKTPFTHLKSSDREGTTVYSAIGQGQIHYFYSRGADVFWVAADPAVAREVIARLLRPDS